MRSHGRILFGVREGEELFYIKTSVSTDICSHEEEPDIRLLVTFFSQEVSLLPILLHQLPFLSHLRVFEIDIIFAKVIFLGLVLGPGHHAVHVLVSVLEPILRVLLAQRP